MSGKQFEYSGNEFMKPSWIFSTQK